MKVIDCLSWLTSQTCLDVLNIVVCSTLFWVLIRLETKPLYVSLSHEGRYEETSTIAPIILGVLSCLGVMMYSESLMRSPLRPSANTIELTVLMILVIKKNTDLLALWLAKRHREREARTGFLRGLDMETDKIGCYRSPFHSKGTSYPIPPGLTVLPTNRLADLPEQPNRAVSSSTEPPAGA